MTVIDVKKNLANLIIAGVNKAGSTSLFHYLNAHPSVCGSRDKETCYFLPLLYNEPLPDLSEYEAQFTHCGNAPFRLEATPAYIYGGKEIALKIKEALGPVKVIIILKDPVERLISFYQRKKTTFQLPQDLSLDEYVKLCSQKSEKELALRSNQVYTGIALGEYDRYIEPWLEIFGNDLKVLFFDDLKKDSRKFMSDLAGWIGIDKSFYNEYDFDVKNKSHNFKNGFIHRIAVTANNTGQRFWRSNPAIKKVLLDTYYKINGTPFGRDEQHEETLEQLRAHFASHNMKLKAQLNKYGYHSVPVWMEAVKETA